MKKVCILILIAVILILTICPTAEIKLIDILIFIFVTCLFDRICFFLGKYIELRRERQKFELIIQKIEDNLKCQKNIR